MPALPVFPAASDPAGVRRNEQRFAALTQTFSDFVWLADVDGRLVSDMPAWREVTGQTAEELLGDGWLGALHPDDRDRVFARWQESVAAKAPYETRYRLVGPNEERWLEVRGAPVLDDDGEVVEWVGTALDVSDQHAADELRQVLAEAADREREVLQQVVDRTPSAIAVLDGDEHRYRLWNDAYTVLVPADRLRPGIALRDAFPEAVEAAGPLLDRALAGEEVVLDQLTVPFDGPGSYDGHRHYRGFLRPLLRGGEPVGVLIAASEITEDVRLRDDLQAQLAAERQLAVRMQAALLPDALPEVPGLVFAERYLTARTEVGVGGDWYDVLPLPGGRVLVSMGDISGRGLRAASEMSQVRAAIRAYANTGAGPGQVLEQTAAFVQQVGLSDMITATVALVDPTSGALELANAGHLAPLLLDAGGAARFFDVPEGLPLGIGGAGGYGQATLVLAPGDRLALFTDGLVERRGRSLADTLEELRARAAAGVPDGADGLAGHLAEYDTPEDGSEDDAAILVVLRPGAAT